MSEAKNEIRLDAIVSAYAGMTYEESVNHQVKWWAAGYPTHNPVGDECCPDFSCCQPQLLMGEKSRQAFLRVHVSGDDATRSQMLMMSLGAALSGENVYIAGDDPEASEH